MIRCFRSVLVVSIVLGTIVTMPLNSLADTSRVKSPAFEDTRGTRSAVRFSLDRGLMPRVAVDARIGPHAHVRFDLHAENIAAKYDVTSVTLRATFEYRFNECSELTIDVGPHPALVANERLAVEYIVRV